MKKKGLTLIELMLAVFIATTCLLALLTLLNSSFQLLENSRNLVLATNACVKKIEEIRNTDFAQIITYNNTNFTASNLVGIGNIIAQYVPNSNNNLINLRVVFCWRNRNNKVIGEDQNLNGRLDSGEDKNNNGLIDSPCVLSTAIVNRRE